MRMGSTLMELIYNTGESPVLTIRLFSGEGSDNCRIVRFCGEQSFAVIAGHNEDEPHLMSLETLRTRKPSLLPTDEGRRGSSESSDAVKVRCKQLKTVQRSGGVSEGSMLGSVVKRSQETLHNEREISTTDTSSLNSEVYWVVQGVRDLHSSNEAAVMAVERRRGTYVEAIHRRKGESDGR
jgi:hypothetical protein